MSRRDTIIIALLANLCLLALLFVLAFNTNEEGADALITHSNQAITPIQILEKPPKSVVNNSIMDEMDNFLKELPKEEIGQPILVDEDGYIELDKLEPAAVVKSIEIQSIDQSSMISTQEGSYVNVTVKRGDALEKIARNNGTTVEAIKKANNMSSTKLVIGQVLRIPISKSATTVSYPTTSKVSVPAPAAPVTTNKEPEKKITITPESKYYTIKNGDSLWKIARELQVKAEDLMQMNGLDEERARNLKVGDKIKVR